MGDFLQLSHQQHFLLLPPMLMGSTVLLAGATAVKGRMMTLAFIYLCSCADVHRLVDVQYKHIRYIWSVHVCVFSLSRYLVQRYLCFTSGGVKAYGSDCNTPREAQKIKTPMPALPSHCTIVSAARCTVAKMRERLYVQSTAL
jgi:hypothetical protein